MELKVESKEAVKAFIKYYNAKTRASIIEPIAFVLMCLLGSVYFIKGLV